MLNDFQSKILASKLTSATILFFVLLSFSLQSATGGEPTRDSIKKIDLGIQANLLLYKQFTLDPHGQDVKNFYFGLPGIYFRYSKVAINVNYAFGHWYKNNKKTRVDVTNTEKTIVLPKGAEISIKYYPFIREKFKLGIGVGLLIFKHSSEYYDQFHSEKITFVNTIGYFNAESSYKLADNIFFLSEIRLGGYEYIKLNYVSNSNGDGSKFFGGTIGVRYNFI